MVDKMQPNVQNPATFRESEERFRLLVDAVQDYAIFMLDTEGHVISWNKGAQRAKGYTEAEIVGRHYSTFYLPEDQARSRPQELLQIAREKGCVEDEGWRVRKDGTRFWADVVITAIYDSKNVLQGFAKVTRDMTERKTAEAKLHEQKEQINQLQKMEAIGRLTGGIAHDFNNLLVGILGCADAMQEMADSEAPIQEEITEIKKACERASTLVRQLTAFNRRQIAVPKMIQINQTIRELIQLLRRSIPSNIEIQCDLEPELPMIKLDANQVEQILINLALNGRDAMLPGGQLQIQTRSVWVDETTMIDGFPQRPARAIMLAVSDTGTGMTPDVKQRIFEPFFTTKEVGKGSGLGLATVYGIVQQNNGGIAVHSQLGLGTTLKIFLPFAGGPGESKEVQSVPPAQAGRSASQGTELILVVEDEALVLRNTVRTLQAKGYAVLSAASAEEALVLFEKTKGKIQLLVTDIIMPGKTGKELADQLTKKNPALPVLFMSGYAPEIIATHGLMSPDIELLEKPYSSAQLAERVRRLLDQKKNVPQNL